MRNEIIIQKMYAYVIKILNYCDDHDYSSFSADSKLVEACVFNLSQLGELCRSADDEFISMHPDIPWKEMYGLRNRIVHDYEGVNLVLVWQIINDDLPSLKQKLQNMLDDSNMCL